MWYLLVGNFVYFFVESGVFFAEQLFEILESIHSAIEIYLVYQIVGHFQFLQLRLDLRLRLLFRRRRALATDHNNLNIVCHWNYYYFTI